MHNKLKEGILSIKVIPKSSRSTITVHESGQVRVYLNSPPADGKANSECIKLFSKALKVPKSNITIIKGQKGRNKESRYQKKEQCGLSGRT